MQTTLARIALVVTASAATMFAGIAGASASTNLSDPVTNVAPAGVVAPQEAKLSHSEAKSMLASSGISLSSSGGCSDRDEPTCTSLEQVNEESIEGAQALASASGCDLTVTGGTEVGHADGTYSHYNGYKLDFSMTDCLSNYITSSYTSIGGSKWEAPSGNIYYDESNHWDVTFYNCGC